MRSPGLPIVFMLISIILYSLFPLVGVFGTIGVPAFAFAGLSHLLSAIISIAGALWLSRQLSGYDLTTLMNDFRHDTIALRQAILSGVINYLSHACLFASFAYISKASATMMFEAWPVLAVIFLVTLSRDNKANPSPKTALNLRFYGLSLMAFIGVILMMFDDLRHLSEDGMLTGFMNAREIHIGLILALLSALFMAYSVALGRNTRVFVEQQYGQHAGKRHELNRALIASSATKIFGSLGFALTLPFMPSLLPAISTMDIQSWGWVIFNGVVIVTLGSLAYREALARTQKVEVAILWYTTPIFALGWLWLANVEHFTPTMLVGAAIIIVANVLLQFKVSATPTVLLVIGLIVAALTVVVN